MSNGYSTITVPVPAKERMAEIKRELAIKLRREVSYGDVIERLLRMLDGEERDILLCERGDA